MDGCLTAVCLKFVFGKKIRRREERMMENEENVTIYRHKLGVRLAEKIA
jgi:hypothetical protein